MIRKPYLLLILVVVVLAGCFFDSPQGKKIVVKKDEPVSAQARPVVVTKSPKEIRLEYAEGMQKSLLSDGVDAQVHASGKELDTLWISFPSMDRPTVYQLITSDGITKQVPQMGFKNLRLDNHIDGLEGYTSSWKFKWSEAAGMWVPSSDWVG